MAWQQLQKCFDGLAAPLIRNSYHRTRGNRRMLDNFGFDFGGADPIAGGLDDVIVPALEIDVTLSVDVAHIAGETPFAGELIAHRDGISPVLFHYYRTVAANRDLAGLAQ